MSNLVTLFSNLRASLDWASARLAESRLAFNGAEPALALAPVADRRVIWTKKLARLIPMLALVAMPTVAGANGIVDYDGDDDGWDRIVEGRLVDVQIKVQGVPAPLFVAPDHSDRTYFEAYAGRNYSIVLHNRSARRVGVLLAVDGINVVNGERTRLSNQESMYVLDPWQRTEIRGWRTSLDQVRRFVFVDERRSYAERTGQANRDMGWIRVLAFPEARAIAWQFNDLRRPWVEKRADDRERSGARTEELDSKDEPQAAAPEAEGGEKSGRLGAASPAPTASRQLQRFRNETGDGGSFPGTGWGDRQYDQVRRVEFHAVTRPMDHLVFRYEYASGLRALGIVPNRDRLGERDGQMGFAKPPRW